jgi:hypothetical protein
MIDGQTSEDARPWGTRMLSPPPVCICETEWRRVVSVFKYDRHSFEIRRADFCDRDVRGIP